MEVYNDPDGVGVAARYLRRSYFTRGQSVPLFVDGMMLDPVPVNDLLP
jgi:hypothetical protein